MKKTKIPLKHKIALAVFMESVPSIIDMWKRSNCAITLDEWLLSVYNEEKQRQADKKSKKECKKY